MFSFALIRGRSAVIGKGNHDELKRLSCKDRLSLHFAKRLRIFADPAIVHFNQQNAVVLQIQTRMDTY
ncbi:hypothetical protein ACROYT_G004675 [Oculina patagonica]